MYCWIKINDIFALPFLPKFVQNKPIFSHILHPHNPSQVIVAVLFTDSPIKKHWRAPILAATFVYAGSRWISRNVIQNVRVPYKYKIGRPDQRCMQDVIVKMSPNRIAQNLVTVRPNASQYKIMFETLLIDRIILKYVALYCQQTSCDR